MKVLFLSDSYDNNISTGQIALGYMKHYVSLVGDHSPETARILLPIGVRIKDIYRKYVSLHENPITKATFYALWKKHMRHVSQPKVLPYNIIFTYSHTEIANNDLFNSQDSS